MLIVALNRLKGNFLKAINNLWSINTEHQNTHITCY